MEREVIDVSLFAVVFFKNITVKMKTFFCPVGHTKRIS